MDDNLNQVVNALISIGRTNFSRPHSEADEDLSDEEETYRNFNNGSNKGYDLLSNNASRVCKLEGCNQPASKRSLFCPLHLGSRRCEAPGCQKCAQGSTKFCISHGGGRRCTFPGCPKGARDRLYCAGHGGGKRCSVAACNKSAVGASNLCTSHGGGRKCQFIGCEKSSQSSTPFCVRHGGGKKCMRQGCTKVSRGRTSYCAAHAWGGVGPSSSSEISMGSDDINIDPFSRRIYPRASTSVILPSTPAASAAGASNAVASPESSPIACPVPSALSHTSSHYYSNPNSAQEAEYSAGSSLVFSSGERPHHEGEIAQAAPITSHLSSSSSTSSVACSPSGGASSMTPLCSWAAQGFRPIQLKKGQQYPIPLPPVPQHSSELLPKETSVKRPYSTAISHSSFLDASETKRFKHSALEYVSKHVVGHHNKSSYQTCGQDRNEDQVESLPATLPEAVQIVHTVSQQPQPQLNMNTLAGGLVYPSTAYGIPAYVSVIDSSTGEQRLVPFFEQGNLQSAMLAPGNRFQGFAFAAGMRLPQPGIFFAPTYFAAPHTLMHMTGGALMCDQQQQELLFSATGHPPGAYAVPACVGGSIEDLQPTGHDSAPDTI